MEFDSVDLVLEAVMIEMIPLLLAMAMMQQPTTLTCPQENGPCKVEPPMRFDPPKPLKCGKYQHVEHWPGSCGPARGSAEVTYSVCTAPPPDKCADDLHTVTEKEWQELMKRICDLEHPTPRGK